MSFESQVKKWAKKAIKRKDNIVSYSFKRLGTLVVNRTPIGDVSTWENNPPIDYRPGTLANNWFAGIGEPEPVELREPNVTAADSLSQIDAASLIAPGKLMHISNPSPHARRNEYGWSNQAPQGMVRISVREWQDIVRQAVANVP